MERKYFKNQAEIYQALFNVKKLANNNRNFKYVHLVDGVLRVD